MPPASRAIPPRRPVRAEKKRRPLASRLYVSFWKRLNILGAPAIAFLRWVEKRLGPSCLPVLLAPVVWLDVARRLADYREFKKLRTIFPADFWRGLPAWRHFYVMVRNWDDTLAAAFLCDRLGQPAWEKRIRVRGTRPDRLPGSAERPLILVHLHTGSYGFLHYWLRAQRLRSTCFWAGDPTIFRTPWASRLFADAARTLGLEEVPPILLPHQLRTTLKFLVPGHILSLAMDAESSSSAPFDAYGHELWLSQGVVRLAEMSGARLIPASVVSGGRARFEIRFGDPVPDALIDARHPQAAIRFLLDQLWPDVEEDPSRLGWNSLLTFDLRSKPNHIPWP